MKKFLLFLFMILCIFTLTNAANAAYIDFASGVFASAVGAPSPDPINHPELVGTQFHTIIEGIGLTIYSYNPGSSYGSADNKISWNPGSSGGVDGIGVNDDEISNFGDKDTDSEYIWIEFDAPQYVSHVDITDLFVEGRASYAEQGAFWLQDQNFGWTIPLDTFTQVDDGSRTSYPNSNGEYILNIDRLIGGIWFTGINSESNYDYSIRGIQIPEPATMLLLGTGLIGLAAIGRKTFIKK